MLTGRPVEATSSAILLLMSQSEYDDFSILSLKLGPENKKGIEKSRRNIVEPTQTLDENFIKYIYICVLCSS